MYPRRIVVTGLGAVSPVGIGVPAFWQALVDARPGVAPLVAFDAAGARPSYAAEVKDFSPERSGLPRRKLKMMGRQAQLAYAAAHEAFADAGLSTDAGDVDRTRLGLVLGVGMLNADVTELGRAFSAAARAAREHANEDGRGEDPFDPVVFGRVGTSELSPLWLLRHIPNLAAAHASISLDAQGASNTITTGCVAAANAVGEAARVIARGEADVVLAGGADARVSPLAMLRYRNLGWLATRDDIEPAAVSAPFDESASGFVNGEGAGLLVLEALEHARLRGARIRAELLAYGAANDAHDLLRPHADGRGLTRALTLCLDRGALPVARADVVFAAASSVPAIDRATAAALDTVFTSHRARPAVTATRAILGHTHAASAAFDCIAAVGALETSTLPPIVNLCRPIADLEFVRDSSRPLAISTALVTAYGFGGHAAALAFGRYAS